MLTGPLRGEAVRTVIGPLDAIDLAAAFAPAEQAARAELGPQGQEATLLRYAELRYRGQEHTLEIPVSSFDLTRLQDAFAQRCLEAYSFRLDSPLEIVSVRVTATAPVAGEVHWGQPAPDQRAQDQSASRVVDLDPYDEPREVQVLGRDLVGADPVSGPCVIEEVAATTLVLPGQAVSADELGNLLIEEQS